MDYSLSKALAYRLPRSPTVIVIYDIMCQYGIHLRRRFGESPYLDLPDGIEIDGGIGLFHVHGHQDSCYPRFAPNFIPGTGMQDGEILETLWAPLKMISGSTRTMTSAHRREILDDHMNDSNWKKLVRMGEWRSFPAAPTNGHSVGAGRGRSGPPALLISTISSVSALCKKLKKARLGHSESQRDHEALSESVDPALLHKWEADEEFALQNRRNNIESMDIYEVNIVKGTHLLLVNCDLPSNF